MGLDIRTPLGLIFMIIGALMTVYGAITHGSTIYLASMGSNVNLLWGLVMLLFGIGMFVAGRRRRSS